MSSAQPRSSADSDPALDDLVQRAQRGELPAFNAIVLRYQDHVYSLVLRMLTHREAAEDVTQEAFVSAWRHIDTFRGGSFRSWLFTIAANRARDDPDRADIDPPEPGPSPEGIAEQGEMRAAIEVALAALPPDWREVIVMSDVHGMDYAEIATATGVALGTVKSRLSRARSRLREVILESRELSEMAQRLSDRR